VCVCARTCACEREKVALGNANEVSLFVQPDTVSRVHYSGNKAYPATTALRYDVLQTILPPACFKDPAI